MLFKNLFISLALFHTVKNETPINTNLPSTNLGVAHVLNKETIHTVYAHLEGTSCLSELFASKLNLQTLGKLIGLMHDIGKLSCRFYNRILYENSLISKDQYLDDDSIIDHSTVGAQILLHILETEGMADPNLYRYIEQFLTIPIACHHTGMINMLDLDGNEAYTKRVGKDHNDTYFSEILNNIDTDFLQCVKEMLLSEDMQSEVNCILNKIHDLAYSNIHDPMHYSASFKYYLGLTVRYLLSCLIDADRLDTERFYNLENLDVRSYGKKTTDWNELYGRFDSYLDSTFNTESEMTDLNKCRRMISEGCLSSAGKPRGSYILSVPTGGGKTLSSLRFALKHAELNNMDRIIYIIPYTSIIDQNVGVVRKALSVKNSDNLVLEHHSNIQREMSEKGNLNAQLLSENWESPIIFTTMVQFLNTLFLNKTSNIRRMHNLANSVLIFDEVQNIPASCIFMFNEAINFLTDICNCTAVMCSATQPTFDELKPPLKYSDDKNLIEVFEETPKVFDRVKIIDLTSAPMSVDGIRNLIMSKINECSSILMVVNTRKAAREIYQSVSLVKSVDIFHLSTNMCPAHRKKVLKEISENLDSGRKTICISTQLIEAGVDLDFNVVIRQLAGIDSIAQSAGRCNRNGKMERGETYIVDIAGYKIPNDIAKCAERSKQILKEHGADNLLSSQTISEYYRYHFHDEKGNMVYNVGNNKLFEILCSNQSAVEENKRIIRSPQTVEKYLSLDLPQKDRMRISKGIWFSAPLCQSFKYVGKNFHPIDSENCRIIIPYTSEGEKILAAVKECIEISDLKKLKKYLRMAQSYSVGLFDSQFNEALNQNMIYELKEGSGIYASRKEYYDGDVGFLTG